MAAGFFEGDERLAVFDGLGHITRKGDPRSLQVSDRQRLYQAIEQGDGPGAQAYLDALLPRHLEMLALLLEWALQLPSSARALTTAAEERAQTHRALERWSSEASSIATDTTTAALVAQVQTLLAQATPDDAPRLREHIAGDGTHPALALLEPVRSYADALRTSLSAGDRDQARAHLEAYFNTCVTLHDAFINFTSAYPTVVLATRGPELALELVRHSFSRLGAYEGLWALPRLLDTEALAAFLAEHLRAHFSGPDRGGSVRIEEYEDCYRLVFDPCGSGGALRRRLAGRWEGALLPEANPMTWGRSGEVPTYCSHCAFNELVSIERFGYPVLVTEFHPDPHRPCGWTLYKRPEAVPEQCYRRLGLEPPSARP